MTKKEDEGPVSGIRPALGSVAAFGALLTLGALALFPAKTGFSVMAGALIATSNLYVLAKIVEALMTPDDEESKPDGEGNEARAEGGAPDEPAAKPAAKEKKKTYSGAWSALAAVKMLVLFGGTWILMTRGLVDPMGLLVGYGSLPIGVSLSGVVSGLRPKKRS